ncbi:hypothetical protein ACTXI4_16750 [Glutamicibacter ardleyensis]|uniref:hypothetical protein n=1 Tax=Glutamicibacter ardleyensis TaxID=225894 RepID=UPI003FD50FC4
MNVSVQGTSGFKLLAVPEGEELVPKLESLMFDAAPADLSPLKTLIAGSLLFGNRGLERLDVNGEVSVSLVEQVQTLLGIGQNAKAGMNLGPEIVDEFDAKIRATTLKINLRGAFAEDTPERDVTTLTLIPSERYSGVLWGIKEAIVASNAWLHEKHSSRAHVAAAVGVLFAEEFLAKSICIPSTSANDALLIRNLCKLAGIDVVFEGE